MFACQQDRKGVKNLAKQQPVKQSSNMHIGVESSREEIYRAVVVCCSRGLLAAAVLMAGSRYCFAHIHCRCEVNSLTDA